MDTTAEFGFKELFAYVVGGVAKAVRERNGELKQQQFDRSRAVTHMILGFLPRDAIEAMIAGHCVMFHELMTDSVRDTLRGEVDTMRRATRSSIVAMDKAFGNNLTRLERYQKRNSEGRRDVVETARPPAAIDVPPATEPAPPQAARVAVAPMVETPMMEAPLVATPVVATPVDASPATVAIVPAERASAPPIVAPADRMIEVAPRTVPETLPRYPRGAMEHYQPSPETIAACCANPEAMAALEEGDPERFAKAMGIDTPSEEFLLAASGPGSPFGRAVVDPATAQDPRDSRDSRD